MMVLYISVSRFGSSCSPVVYIYGSLSRTTFDHLCCHHKKSSPSKPQYLCNQCSWLSRSDCSALVKLISSFWQNAEQKRILGSLVVLWNDRVRPWWGGMSRSSLAFEEVAHRGPASSPFRLVHTHLIYLPYIELFDKMGKCNTHK